MSAGLKIKEVADASGFTTATLRYYEQIGLLPEASRTAAGYRVYDQRTLDRLAFIARAKQLGCSLEEIAGLTTAWDGGQCGPVQEQLRHTRCGQDRRGSGPDRRTHDIRQRTAARRRGAGATSARRCV